MGSDVCLDARPEDQLQGPGHHPAHPLVCGMQVFQDFLAEVWRDDRPLPAQEDAIGDEELVAVPVVGEELSRPAVLFLRES